MNPTPITGSVNEKGMFTAENICHSNYHRQEYSELYPPLPCYTPSNLLVTNEEHVEVVGPVWAKKSDRSIYWTDPTDNFKLDQSVEPIYITIPQTEKESQYTNEEYLDLHGAPDGVYPEKIKSDMTGMYKGDRVFDKKDNLLKNWTGYASKAKCMYDDNDGYQEWNVTDTPDRDKANGYLVRDCWVAIDKAPLTDAKPFKAVDEPEAQPLEGVKTAEETYPELKERLSKITDPIEREAEEFASLNFSDGTGDSPYVAGYEGVLHGIQWQKEQSKSAQFATDAGGCKRVDADKVMRTYFNIDNYTQEGLDRFTAYSQDVLRAINLAISQVSAHSNNSSSEMVEVEKVVSLVSNFYKGSSCYSEMLITQIRTKK